MAKLYKKLISLSRFPPGVLTWNYINNPRPIIQLHNDALLSFSEKHPKWLQVCHKLVRFICWYFFFGWRAVIMVWKKLGKNRTKPIGIPLYKQLIDLFKLTFLFTIPPAYYYNYRLYLFSSDQWLDFIYNHETWQRVLSPKVSRQSNIAINSKHDFFKLMKSARVPSVLTIQLFQKGTEIVHENIFQEREYCFKPNAGSQQRGIFLLRYLKYSNSYLLEDHTKKLQIRNTETILSFLKNAINQEDYLMQPLLKNHPRLEQIVNTEKLAVFRVVSYIKSKRIQIISAVLMIFEPYDVKLNRIIRVNLQKGKLASTYINQEVVDKYNQKQLTWLDNFKGCSIPFWKGILNAVKKGHQLFPDIYVIGWDVVVTPNGVKILEGNIGLGASIQLLDVVEGTNSNVFTECIHEFYIEGK